MGNLAGQGPTRPDTSQIFGPRTASKTIFVSSSLSAWVVCCLTSPPVIFFMVKVLKSKGAVHFAIFRKRDARGMDYPNDIQRHLCLGGQGIEFTSALTLRYSHNLPERGTRVATSAKEVKVATFAVEESSVPKVLKMPYCVVP